MPHITIEYSSNLDAKLDISDVVDSLHLAAIETGVFPLGGIRTRAARRDTYRVADGAVENAFVHVTIRIREGRDLSTRQSLGDHVFRALTHILGSVFSTTPMGISLEVQEIDADLNFKKNNLHERLKQNEQVQGT